MTRIAIVLSLTVALFAACSKDDAAAPGQKVVEPGVSAVPASELGPNTDVKVEEISITTASEDARRQFVRGRELFENVRHAEAVAYFDKAIELDPGFALAHAYRGSALPGDEGRAELERALELARSHPHPEKLVVESMLLKRKGDVDGRARVVEELVRVAPGDFRVHVWYAALLQEAGKVDGALAAYEQAARLAPGAAELHNHLAYLHAFKGNMKNAVVAARKYASLKPGEPNPQDTLGEMLLMAGELEQSEQAFLRALEVEPSFSIAWEGVAMARFYRDDWKAGFEAYGKARDGAPDGDARRKMTARLAWAHLAAGDLPAALAEAETVTKGAELDGLMLAAELHAMAGKRDEARELLDSACALVGDDPADVETHAWATITSVIVEVEDGKLDAAKKALADVTEHEAKMENSYFRYGAAYARGIVALANNNGEEALKQLAKISNPLLPYGLQAQWKTVDALQLVGRAGDAKALAERLRSAKRRQVFALVLQSRNRS